MFTRRAKLLWLLLIFFDLILLALAFEIAYLARANVPGLRLFYLNPAVATALLLTAGVLWTGIGVALQVYRRAESFRPGPLFRLTVSQAVWFGLTLPTAIYLLKLGEISRSFLVLFVFLALLLQSVYRLMARRMRQFLQQEFTKPRHYLIVGTGPKALELARRIEQNEDHGDRILGFVWEAERKQEPAEA
ncbi:MAG: nucleoside-diphosphate sugar epimerase/dehydratase, partial [Terriglobia bacterium]